MKSPITIRDMKIDDVDSGIPLLTLVDPDTGESRTYGLAPCAVTALVDSLAGVAEPKAGEVRIIAKLRAEDLIRALGSRK